MAKELSERNKLLLDLIYDEGLPDNMVHRVNEVKVQAGYAATTSPYSLINNLKDEIVDRNLYFMALYSAAAINRLKEVIEKPTTPGADNIIKAANSLLDRAGLGKKETQEVEIRADQGIVILPAKRH